jgi:hypothetical protein
MGCPVRGNVRVHARSHCQNERHSIAPPSHVDNLGEYNLSGLFRLTSRKHRDEEDNTARDADKKERNLRLRQLAREKRHHGRRERLEQDIDQVDLPLRGDKVFMPEPGDRGCDLGTHNGGAGREETVGDDGEPAHDESHARPRARGGYHECEMVLASRRWIRGTQLGQSRSYRDSLSAHMDPEKKTRGRSVRAIQRNLILLMIQHATVATRRPQNT